MNHVMLDLETLGTRPGCVILSIGACTFDPRLGPHKDSTFYAVLNREDQKEKGLFEDEKTLGWWQKQNTEAWNAATSNAAPTLSELKKFRSWWKSVEGLYLWSQGSNFDGPLAEALFAAFGLSPPWKFYNTRDTRTVYQMCHVGENDVKREGVYHNALDDALHQARKVAHGVRKITLKMET